MEELSQKKKIQIIRLYFSGQSFEKIAVKTGTAKGSVSNVVAELKGGLFPETADLTEQLEGLRELSVLLNKLKKTPAESLVGLAVLSRIF